MRAIQVSVCGGPERLLLGERPDRQPGEGEVAVNVAASGVNFIDVYHREGRYPLALPFVPGLEGAGTVTAVGAGVTGFRPGDRIAWATAQGSYAERHVLPAAVALPVPAEMDLKDAAALALQSMTVHMLVVDVWRLAAGQTVLVHAAAGGVGLLLCAAARHLGARVIGTTSTPEKAALARAAGADDVILYTAVDFEAEVKRLTDGRGVDVVYDSVGKTTFEKSLNCLRPRGMLVLFGGSSGPAPSIDPIVLMQKGSLFLTRPTLFHYTATPSERQARWAGVLEWWRAGVIKATIGGAYPLAEAAQAHRDLEARKTTGKLILVP
jgi:NADPH2:quinone reductase